MQRVRLQRLHRQRDGGGDPYAAHTGADGDADGSIDGHFTLSWNPVTDAAHYSLQEQVNNSGNWTHPADIDINGTSAPVIRANGTFKYRVQACNSAGNCGGWSNEVTVHVDIPGAPDAPAYLGVSGPTLGCMPAPATYTVEWGVSAGASYYELHETELTLGLNVTHTQATTVKSFTKNPVDPYAYYFTYSVRACAANGQCSSWRGPKRRCVGEETVVNSPLTTTTMCTPTRCTVQ